MPDEKMTKEDKILCHLQQACGACAAFNHAWAHHQAKCKLRNMKAKPVECHHAENPGPHCCAALCPTFDRENFLNED